ncbi:MAG: ribbon-helix-helix domain-containing protein [Candidatus Korarchaeota archaeon]|nr:ribbon-helix-helix domain-containing protein [Candidatus Korarchaeota archaeon]
MSQQVSLQVDKELIDAIDALVSEGMFKSRSEAIKAALMGFIRTKNAERVRAVYEEFISEAVSHFRR